ncbi:MAG: MFS transporter [Chloroflexi bacterium]|nr:MFS transporter [Chloroflexota bacterium]
MVNEIDSGPFENSPEPPRPGAGQDAVRRPLGPGWWKAFSLLWAGQALSLFGSRLAQFAVIWWLTDTTHSATVLSLATVCTFLPEIFLAPFAGALVDRWNRKLVMMVSDGLVALAALVLVYLFWSGSVQSWHVFLIIFLRAASGVFQFPAVQSSTSLMVPDEHLSRVAGLNMALQGAMNIVAPPLAALLLASLPVYQLVLMDVITAALAVGILVFVFIPRPSAAPAEGAVTPRSVWNDVRAGLRYALGWPGLMWILVLAALINFLFTPASTLMPLLITDYFKAGAQELGWMESAWSIGMLAGGMLLSVWGGTRRKVVTSMLGLVGMGAGMLLVSAAPANRLWMALAGMAIGGVMNPITNGPLFALLQSKVAPDMQGRVFTLVTSFANAMIPLSMLMAGPLAEAFGIRFWYWGGAIGCMLLGLAGLCIPAVMHIEEDRPSAALGGVEAGETAL